MHETICNAINNKRLLELSYNERIRIVEPHIYGVNETGNTVLLCYQVRGSHTSDKPHNWTWLIVSKISGLSDTGDQFLHARSDYKRNDKNMTTIYAQLDI